VTSAGAPGAWPTPDGSRPTPGSADGPCPTTDGDPGSDSWLAPGGADGASAERTRLAWRRTVLSTTAVALLTIRVAVSDRISPWTALAIAATCLGWLAGLWLAQQRIHSMSDREPRNIGRTLPAMALTMVGFAVLGMALIAAHG